MKPEDDIRHKCDVLKVIAAQYPEESIEHITLQKSAIALQIIHNKNLETELEEIFEGIGKPLNEDQKQHLRSMGINPDEYKQPSQNMDPIVTTPVESGNTQSTQDHV